MNKILRFQEALDQAIEFIEQHRDELGKSLALIRDLYGRFRMVTEVPLQPEKLEQLSRLFHQILGNFSPQDQSMFLDKETLFDPDAVFSSPDKLEIPGHPGICFLDRQIMGQDWLRKPITEVGYHPPRVTFYGIKGGVGRSTALALWAWHLAGLGKKVLILDLDLESPGISQTLLPLPNTPDFGIVDWLVEDLGGQADDSLLFDMVGHSPFATSFQGGTIRVVPAAGKKENDYLAKLSRAYLDVAPADLTTRLLKMLHQLEKQEKPDVVLLDSRAGIHDIAAIMVTRLNAYALLFAVNTSQTWNAYRLLFQHWQKWHFANLNSFRNKLKMVASMLPETRKQESLSQFIPSAYSLFADTLYEQVEASEETEETEVFNFDENAIEAPHYPLVTHWNRGFQEFNPVRDDKNAFDEDLIRGNYGKFLRELTTLVIGDSEVVGDNQDED